ncbi:hypothetical protein [Photobacterium sanguinicancri]|uniref:hypothetical protein n=1 Tax=Photobacterium sanguinicancri TaxID=875932 RepID=UPI003D11D2E9
MESLYGPIETPNYTELLKGSVIDSDEKMISASEGTSTVGIRAIGGAVLVSDKRVFFAQWSTDLLKYYTVYSVKYDDIKSYGMCSPLASTVSLIGKVFCVNDGTEEILFATEQVDSIIYEIKRHNPLAKRDDD